MASEIWDTLLAMSGFLIGVAGTVVAGVILWAMGIGRGVSVRVHGGGQQRRTGKKMVLIAWAMIILGVILGGQHALPQGGWNLHDTQTLLGLGLVEIGGIVLIIGSIVAWFQKS